jgi:hypothetical protein
MSMFTHLIAADVRRHRLLLAAWVVIVAATATVDGARPILSDGALVRTVGILGSLLSLTQALLMLVLIPSVVQTHPLVGSNAFWMTRPIPPDILLVSKVVLLGAATVALPTLVESVLMAAYHVPVAQIVSVAAQTGLHQTFWMILLMTAAALTPNLMRFTLVCGGALAALALFLAVTVAMFMTRMNDVPLAAGEGGTDEPTAGFVLNVLVVVVGLSTLVVQFRSRSRLRSVPVGATGLLLAFAIESMWPWPVLRPRIAVPSWAQAEAALHLSASAESVQIREEMSPFSQRLAWRSARARVRLAGIEPNWSADARVLHAGLQLQGGTRLDSSFSGIPIPAQFEGSEEPPMRRVFRELLGVERLVDSGPPRGELAFVFFLRDADFQRVAPATGSYRGMFEVKLTSHELEASLPLQRGATHQNGAYRLVVSGVEHASTSVSILARESDATSIFDRRPTPVLNLYLRNRHKSEAVAGFASDFDQGAFLSGFLPFHAGRQTSGFRARSVLIRFPPGYGDDKETLSIDDEWLEGAELVVVRTMRQGSVERRLDIEDFPLRAASKSIPASER